MAVDVAMPLHKRSCTLVTSSRMGDSRGSEDREMEHQPSKLENTRLLAALRFQDCLSRNLCAFYSCRLRDSENHFGQLHVTAASATARVEREGGGAPMKQSRKSCAFSQAVLYVLRSGRLVVSNSAAMECYPESEHHQAPAPSMVPAELYCAEGNLGSGSQPLKSVKDAHGVYTGNAPDSWYNARTEAPRRYSIKDIRVKPVDPQDKSASLSPQPKILFQLKPRADHSNYPECNICRASRLVVERLIAESTPRVSINKERVVLMAHVHDMMAERDVCAELAGDASRSNKIVFCLDDKLVSHWQSLPIPPGGRDGKNTAGRWRYRQCLQGNSFPGVCNFVSVVPPMLHTGSNVGFSAFVYSLYRLIETGKLDARAKRIARQTDGGPDNVSWVTHGVHFMLVREGVFNQIVRIRLLPGHSHNPQTFSITKTIFIPAGGDRIGCTTPWEMECRLVDGLKKMNGGLEMLWQLASFDFTDWLDGCEQTLLALRLRRDPHGARLCSRFNKTALTEGATDSAAEFKPLLPAPETGGQRQSDPSGIQFMHEYPSISDDPGVEPWEGASEKTDSADAPGWNREKVVLANRAYVLANRLTCKEESSKWQQRQ
eukprot:3026021-Pleurochrysis_carterae.AAC.9